MSYDSLEVLEGFHSGNELPYPLLRDVDAAHVIAYGVLNEDYEPGHRGYGIPHPGVFLVDRDGVIQGKFAVPGYRQRPPFEDMLIAARALPEGSPPAAMQTDVPTTAPDSPAAAEMGAPGL